MVACGGPRARSRASRRARSPAALCGKTCSSSFAIAGVARPSLGGGEQRGADAAAPVRRGDDEAEVGDVRARRVRVARERQPADDLAVELGDEERGVRVPAHRADVPPLVGDAAPGSRRRAASPRAPRRPPRRARPAPRASPGSAGRTRAVMRRRRRPRRRGAGRRPPRASRPPRPRPPAAPPKKRFRRRQRDDLVAHRLEAVELGRVRSALAVDVRLVEVDARRRRSPRRPAGRARATLTTICMIAPRSRAEPGAADDEPRPPVAAEHDRRRHHARQPPPGRRPACLPTRSYSPSMLFR